MITPTKNTESEHADISLVLLIPGLQHHMDLDLVLENNNGVDHPAHPCSPISAFVIRCLKNRVVLNSRNILVGLNMIKPLATPLKCHQLMC